MISQKNKDIYFLLVFPIIKLNYLRYRLINCLPKFRRQKKLLLNIGSGRDYRKGFINIEGNIFRKKDIWLDIRQGLPFSEGSVDFIYADNIFEHFYISELEFILSECSRILRKSGMLVIIVPNLDNAIEAYVSNNLKWFDSNFPRKFISLGGKLFNFLMCDSQHKLIFDFSFLVELLQMKNFTKVIKLTFHDGNLPYGEYLTDFDFGHDLIVIAEK